MSDDIDTLLAQEVQSLQNEEQLLQQQQLQQDGGDQDGGGADHDGQNDSDDSAGGGGNPQHQQQQPVAFDPTGLIPACIQNPSDPSTFRADVFGYDITRIAERPWAKPGANVADYFNYGFDEHSWRVYCALQLRGAVSHRAKADAFLSSVLMQHQAMRGVAGATTGTGVASSSSSYRAPGTATVVSATAGAGASASSTSFSGGESANKGGDGSSSGATVFEQEQHAQQQQAATASGMMYSHHHHHHHHHFRPHHHFQHHHLGHHHHQPPSSMHHQQHMPAVSYFKTRLCNAFMITGSCMNGLNCRYAHGEADKMPHGLPRGIGAPTGTAPPTMMMHQQQQQQQQLSDYFNSGADETGERSAKKYRPEEQ